jgi:Family of unknown function (DUF6282)
MLLGVSGGIACAQPDLTGVIDIHAHTAPSSRPRSIDAIDLAKLAKQRGMRGFVIKDHYEPTADQAYLVRKAVPGLEVFGGIVLNRSVGGINMAALERMVLMTGNYGRVVWLPTMDAENQVQFNKEKRPFVAVTEDGHLLAAVIDVIEFCKQHQLTLETGHISAQEGLLVVHEARKEGVEHVVVTHAMDVPVRMTIPQMVEAAKAGAYIEFVYSALVGKDPIPVSAYVEAIRKIGPAWCILSSDFGQPENPPHTVGLAAFFEKLRAAGISQGDIDTMAKTNPAKVLGLQQARQWHFKGGDIAGCGKMFPTRDRVRPQSLLYVSGRRFQPRRGNLQYLCVAGCGCSEKVA